MSESKATEFWDSRYRAGQIPWDLGGVPEAVTRFIASESAPLSVLICDPVDDPDGPPFPIAPDELESLLKQYFQLKVDEPVRDSQPLLAGNERWQIWKRTGGEQGEALPSSPDA